jgi:hypothetical protein
MPVDAHLARFFGHLLPSNRYFRKEAYPKITVVTILGFSGQEPPPTDPG